VTISEKDEMFAGVPHELFRVHNWRTDVAKVGEVSAKFINELCDKAPPRTARFAIHFCVEQLGFLLRWLTVPAESPGR
jgi:hypothetical protein